jgi:hypothetical protein
MDMSTMPSTLFDQFTSTLKLAMAKNKLTGQELSRRSGVHWVTISRILNGAVDNTTFDVAEKLLKAAGVKVENGFKKIG